MTNAPPRLAEALLRALLPKDVRDEAIDDLAALFEAVAERDGRAHAVRWYWKQVPAFALRVRASTIAGGSLAVGPTGHEIRRGRERMWTTVADVRYSLRALLRNPGFTAIAVLTLALGIGANAAIFSVARAVLLRPLPFTDPDRLVEVSESRLDRGWTSSSFTHANFWDVHDMNRSLSAVGALSFGSGTMMVNDEPRRVSIGFVTAGFFKALGVTAVAGRVFADGEDAIDGERGIILLSHALWQSRFASDTTIVGRRLVFEGAPVRVIGVLPRGTPWLDAAEAFIPLRRTATLDRGSFELAVVGRLAPNVTIDGARADLGRIATQLAAQYPEAKGMGVTVDSSREWVASDTLRRAIWVLMGAVGFLLLIACVNLANLLLARATGRVRERALRSALGASRGRIVQLMLTETLILGVAGAALGVWLAGGLVRLLRHYDPGDIPRLADARIDGWVLAAAIGAGLLSGILSGLVPALRTPYDDMVSAIRDGERSMAGGRRSGRLRGALVGAEVALSIVLLVGAGLLVRSFGELLGVDRGFRTADRMMFDISLPAANSEADFKRGGHVMVDFLSRVKAQPEVAAVGAVSMRPLRGVGTGMGFAAADKPSPAADAVPWASWRRVTGDYFQAMGLSMVAGRTLTEQDGSSKEWRVVISRSIADRLWSGENAVGKTLILWKGQSNVPAQVIGVVGDMRDWGLERGPSMAVYFHHYAGASEAVNFVVQTSLSKEALSARLRGILTEINPNIPLSTIRSLDEMVGRSVASRRFTMLLLAGLAGVALLLSIAGVYGVLSYTVSRRKPEIGVRIALGATSARVVRHVIAQGMRPVLIGVVVGVGGALALSRLMASLLYGVTPADTITYVVVPILLAGAALAACYLPARSALRVDVMVALREE